MWPYLKKINVILERQDRARLFRLLGVVMGMVVLELVGIFSILPFLQVAASPEKIETNPWLNWIYQTFGFTSSRSLLIWLGIAVLAIYFITSIYSVFTHWMIQKTIWDIAHRISMRSLEIYARLPFEFFTQNNSAEIVKKLITDISNLVSLSWGHCKWDSHIEHR